MLLDNYKIIEKREAKFKLYKEQYDEYISASKKEKNIVQEYQGRELLELIQNAEDESTNRQGNIKIKLNGKILTIQNSGKPFSYEGILSLMTANFSIKDSSKYIGNKGLGFRAVLGWSNKVSIFSKKLAVSFSREDAKILQDRLELEVGDKTIYQFDKYLIPIFSAPNIDIEYICPDEGMDTLIRLECKEEALNRENGIISQLHSINGKELLFLKNTSVIEIQIDDEFYHKFEIIDDAFNKIENLDILYKKSIIANNHSNDSFVYHIYQQTGDIDFVNIEQEIERKQYLLSIAIPVGDAPFEKKMYSFFRTNIDSPFNFILNASLELNQSRNDIIPSVQTNDFNSQVISLLPTFIMHSVKNHFEMNKNISYDLIKLLVNLDKKFLSINGYNFYSSYMEKLRSAKIFPNVNKKYISYEDEPVFYSSRYLAQHLIGDDFENLLQWTDNLEVIEFCKSIGLYIYNQDSFVRKINKSIGKLTINDRIELIIGFVDEYRKVKNNTGNYPFLLLDTSGNSILSDNTKVYNKPLDANISNIPDFLSSKLNFLNSDMFKGIEKYINFKTTNKIRESIDLYLQYFGVNEYSFKALEPSINNTRNLNLNREQLIELIEWLYKIYIKQKNEDLSGMSIRINLPSVDKRILSSDMMYFSEHYDNRFYASLIKNASSNVGFMERKEKMNLGNESNENVIRFFSWLGVNKRPKIVIKTMDSKNLSELKNYMNNCLTHYAKSEILSSQSIIYDEASVYTYEYFDDILSKVDFEDVLKWLMDEYKTFGTPVSSKKELQGSKMIVSWSHNPNRYIYENNMDSYVRWKLMSYKWIKVKHTNDLQSVTNCLLEDMNLVPYLYHPDINYSVIKKYNQDYSQLVIDEFLSELKVTGKLKELAYNRFYRLLYQLPEIDKDLRITRKIYDILMEKVTDDNGNYEQFINSEDYKKFKNEGKVLAKAGKNFGFYNTTQTYYSDKKDLCNGILEELAIFDIARRSGQEKVSKIFGVQLFKNTKVDILELTPSILDADFKKKVESIKPYIYIYRNDNLSEIKNLKITLGSKISIRYSLNSNVEEEYTLKEYESIYSRDRNDAYISIPMSMMDTKSLFVKYEFYESFAELITVILDVAKDKEIYKNLMRDSLDISKRSLIDLYGNKGQDLLDNARKKLGYTVTHEDQFWTVIEKTTNRKIDSLKNDYTDINYANINAEENIPLLSKLFKELGTEIVQFNANSDGNPAIDVSNYAMKQIRHRLAELRPLYEGYLYNYIVSDSKMSKSDKFVKIMESYDFIYQKIDVKAINSFSLDIDDLLLKLLHLNTLLELTIYKDYSIREIIKLNIEQYSKEHPEKYKEIQSAFDMNKIHYYSLFNELNDLHTSIPRKSPQVENGSIKQIDKNGLSIEQIKNKVLVDIRPQDTDIVNLAIDSVNHNSVNTYTKGKVVKINPQNQLDNGCIAEYFVYKKLSEEFGKVKWISGNAQRVLNYTDVDDSKGYDMIYIDQFNDERFVEVKSSQDKSLRIKMSKNEVEKGLDNSNKYDIHFVNLDDNQKPTNYYRIKNFFKFEEGEDFFNNSKFHVETDNYDIRAKIDTEGNY